MSQISRVLCCKRLVAGFGLAWLPVSAWSLDFLVGDMEGLFNTTLAYGLMWRVEDRDPELIGGGNGGNNISSNYDDGNLNYDKGIVSNIFRVTSELELNWRNFGYFGRVLAFYDYENQHGDRARTALSDDAKRVVGKDIAMLDNYVSARFDVGNIPIQVRLGRQVVAWGENRSFTGGINIINPIDGPLLTQPVSTPRDARIPEGMLWASALVTNNIAIEAFYQYEWRSQTTQPLGTFFSPADLGGGDAQVATINGGMLSDLGTDLDGLFGLPSGTLGFDQRYFMIPRGANDEAADGSQFGVKLQGVVPSWNDTTFAVHAVRYHSRDAIISARVPDQHAIDSVVPDAQATAAELLPVYRAQGLSPQQAASAAAAAGAQVSASNYFNQARYFLVYPEDISMVGFSFNTTTIATGMALSGELAYHWDFPAQIHITETIASVSTPLPGVGPTQLGSFGANDVVDGFKRVDKLQAALNLSQLLGPRLGASSSLLAATAGWTHIPGMPDQDDLRLNGPGANGVPPESSNAFADGDAWGYRMLGQLTYSGVLGLNLSPRVGWRHDVSGTSVSPRPNFIEGSKAMTIGLGIDYLTTTLTADISYTSFWGGGRYNLVNDRDFVRFNVKYSF